MPRPPTPVTAIVLAGGAARRWGGRDKTAAPLAGKPLLAHVIDGLPAGTPAIVVGRRPDEPEPDRRNPDRQEPERRPVRWTREDPPGAGPVAALAAGVGALPPGVEIVVVLAADQPFAGPAIPRLLAALHADPEADAAVGTDPDGRRQPLLAAYRVRALRAALTPPGRAPETAPVPETAPAPEPDPVPGRQLRAGTPPRGRPLHAVLACLTGVISVPVSSRECWDLDTPEQLDAAAAALGRPSGQRSHFRTAPTSTE